MAEKVAYGFQVAKDVAKGLKTMATYQEVWFSAHCKILLIACILKQIITVINVCTEGEGSLWGY